LIINIDSQNVEGNAQSLHRVQQPQFIPEIVAVEEDVSLLFSYFYWL